MDVRGVSLEVRLEFKALCNYYEFCFHVYVFNPLNTELNPICQ